MEEKILVMPILKNQNGREMIKVQYKSTAENGVRFYIDFTEFLDGDREKSFTLGKGITNLYDVLLTITEEDMAFLSRSVVDYTQRKRSMEERKN